MPKFYRFLQSTKEFFGGFAAGLVMLSPFFVYAFQGVNK